LADGFGERADLEETHEHRVVTGAVEAWLVGDDTISFAVVLEHVITSCKRKIDDHYYHGIPIPQYN
jgi:hypothetical protein